MIRRKIQWIAGVFLVGIAYQANAIPTLFFDGDFSYSASTGLLDVSATLNDYQDLSPAPVLAGSSLALTSVFSGLGALSGPLITVGTFGGVAGNDLSITGGDSDILLEAEMSSLTLAGVNGLDFGIMIATFDATGGSLVSQFLGSDLFALQLNLSTPFAGDMFRTDFAGVVDGSLTGKVPEPGMLALIATGLLLIGLMTRRRAAA